MHFSLAVYIYSKDSITTGRIFVYSHGRSTLRPRCTHVQLIGRSHISRRLVIEWWRNFIPSAGSFRSSPLWLISLLFYRIHRPAIRLHPLASPTSAPSSGSCVHLQQFGSSVKLFPLPCTPEQNLLVRRFDVWLFPILIWWRSNKAKHLESVS